MPKTTTYKDTELWPIPQEWEVLTIDDISEVIGWGTPSTKDIENFWGEIPRLTPKDLSNFSWRYIKYWERNITKKGLDSSSAKLMPKGTVLLTSRAPIWYVAISDTEVSTNQWFKSMICDKEKANNLFLFYLMQNSKEKLENNWSWSTFKEISWGVLKKMKFAFPPLPEQQAIASVLSSLDDKIELLREQNQTLENIGQALFKSWFVDFEPWQDDLVESEMGMIPRGWKVGKLGDIIKLRGWHAFKSSQYTENGQYWIVTIKNVNDAYFDKTTMNYILEIPEKMKSWCNLKTWDVLMSLTGNVWRVCIVDWDKFLLNQRVVKFEPQEQFDMSFGYFLFRQKDIQEKLISISRWTAQMNLSPVETEKLEYVIPDQDTVEKYKEQATELFEKIVNNNQQIQTLANTRDSLLPRLMSGKVRLI